MGYLALVLMVAFGVFCIGVRTWMHVRQTGRSPFLSGGASGKLATAAYAVLFSIAAFGDVSGALPRLAHSTPLGVVGAALAVAGIAMTMYAQVAMGESWRIGIDPDEHTALVTTGPYRVVRNPIYTAMFAFAIGIALVVPNVVAIVGAIVQVLAIEFIVRRVEEPYLRQHHGEVFETWSKRTGRFVPRLQQT
ncbi:MAG: hypothetical protein QOF21_2886 [Actinomycetota bacterium]|jgi:protein-S-isoprenylcysteine O-methyltransferase Ste14